MRLSIPVSGFVAAVVGFGGTLALVIAAADAVGASHQQTASMVTALCLAMAVETMWLSWYTKMPVISAWSTPGAALIGASTGFSINEAVGAFVLVGLMLTVTGLFKPLMNSDLAHSQFHRVGNARRHPRHIRDQRGEDHSFRSAAHPASDRRLFCHPHFQPGALGAGGPGGRRRACRPARAGRCAARAGNVHADLHQAALHLGCDRGPGAAALSGHHGVAESPASPS